MPPTLLSSKRGISKYRRLSAQRLIPVGAPLGPGRKEQLPRWGRREAATRREATDVWERMALIIRVWKCLDALDNG